MNERVAPPISGRGAQSAQVPQRFGLNEREADGDWQDVAEALDGPAPKLRTTVTEEHPKTILSFNQSPDIPFDRSINAYRGCERPPIPIDCKTPLTPEFWLRKVYFPQRKGTLAWQSAEARLTAAI